MNVHRNRRPPVPHAIKRQARAFLQTCQDRAISIHHIHEANNLWLTALKEAWKDSRPELVLLLDGRFGECFRTRGAQFQQALAEVSPQTIPAPTIQPQIEAQTPFFQVRVSAMAATEVAMVLAKYQLEGIAAVKTLGSVAKVCRIREQQRLREMRE